MITVEPMLNREYEAQTCSIAGAREVVGEGCAG
jgi:hypothetical protein